MKTVVVDQSRYGVLRLGGRDRAGFLHRITTADIESLAPGQHAWTCLLSPKGRVLSVFDVWAEDDEFLLLMEPILTESTQTLLGKYALMDDVTILAHSLPCHRIWDSPATVWTAPPVFTLPLTPTSESQVRARRIEAGFPAYGIDVTADNFPFESGLERFIDHKKGCYIGQEPVARVRDRGAPQKYLRGLRLSSRVLPGHGAEIKDAVGKVIGQVTSAAESDDFGPIALAYLPRGIEIGGTVEVSGKNAEVRALPMGE